MKGFTLSSPLSREVFKRINPILFDVSLRDGIQGAKPSQYPTSRKIELLHSIYDKYQPKKMEVGSMVSKKILPIMADTMTIHQYVHYYPLMRGESLLINPFVLVPNTESLIKCALEDIKHFSFITSVSNEFQLKNTRTGLPEQKKQLAEMMRYVKSVQNRKWGTKLYISCISECPFSGQIPLDRIVGEILYYCSDDYGEICLSDTMGTLKNSDFTYIVNKLVEAGVDMERISVHLHINRSNTLETKLILYTCFGAGIRRFDVVSPETESGGCSVTLHRNQLKPNMTYEFFYSTLHEYLDDDERHYFGL